MIHKNNAKIAGAAFISHNVSWDECLDVTCYGIFLNLNWTLSQSTYIPFWCTGSPVSRADLWQNLHLTEMLSVWLVITQCHSMSLNVIHCHLISLYVTQCHFVSLNVTYLLGEQLETLVNASLKMADRLASSSKWGVRIWPKNGDITCRVEIWNNAFSCILCENV